MPTFLLIIGILLLLLTFALLSAFICIFFILLSWESEEEKGMEP